jgi:hypothetical protein
MKRLTIIVAILFVFSSCTKDTEEATTTSTDYHGKWKLVSMYGAMLNMGTVGTAMEWQETYLFNNDGTFTKSRVQNTEETKTSGTYTTVIRSDAMYLELTYTNDNEIIGNCFGNLKEELYINANNSLLSTWSACDGPVLEYKKIN